MSHMTRHGRDERRSKVSHYWSSSRLFAIWRPILRESLPYFICARARRFMILRDSLFRGPLWTPPGGPHPERCPCAGQQILGISGHIKGHIMSKSFKKSRAARARNATRNGEKRDFAQGIAKSEGTVKMTYSIPDFLSRDEDNVTTDSLFGGPARETVYLRPDSERESIS